MHAEAQGLCFWSLNMGRRSLDGTTTLIAGSICSGSLNCFNDNAMSNAEGVKTQSAIFVARSSFKIKKVTWLNTKCHNERSTAYMVRKMRPYNLSY